MSNHYKNLPMDCPQEIKDLDNLFSQQSKLSRAGWALNNLQDYRNIQVLVWTIPKTGTMTLSNSFQYAINKKTQFKNVAHCHGNQTWYTPYKLFNNTNFNFNLFIKYLNYFGTRPLMVYSYREPISRLISTYFEMTRGLRITFHLCDDIIKFLDNHNFNTNNYSSLPESNSFNKQKGIGFYKEENYDV